MSEAADALLGTNIEAPAPPGPPPPPETAAPTYVMAVGEQFNRDQYIAAGWTDAQARASTWRSRSACRTAPG
jgi:hypothetical protein